ncbi:MAG: hypothetical protein ACYC6B_04605 [Thermoleophilia bacterium]
MEYMTMVKSLHDEAESVLATGDSWTATQVSRRLLEIADAMVRIRNQHESGIDASMGKRSGHAGDI